MRSWWRQCAKGLLPVLGLMVGVPAARAEVPPPRVVVVQTAQCVPDTAMQAPLLRAIELELRQEGVDQIVTVPSGEESVAELAVLFDCTVPSQRVELRLSDPRLSPVTRLVDLSDLESRAIPRAVALVAAELARSLWLAPPRPAPTADREARSDASARPAPLTPPGPVSAGKPAARLASRREPAPSPSTPALARGPEPGTPEIASSIAPVAAAPLALVALGAGRVFASPVSVLPGGSAAVALGRIRLGFMGLAWSAQDRLGTVGLWVAAGTGSFALFPLYRGRSSATLDLRTALGQVSGRGGSLSPEVAARSFSRPYAEMGVAFRSDIALAKRLFLESSLEIGYSVGQILKSDDRRIIQAGGPMLGIQLGLLFEALSPNPAAR